MAGGKGERFWPLSTEKRPKQVLSLVGGKPMISLAVGYLDGLIPPERTFIITSKALVDAIAKAAPEIPSENIIGEPMGRDTAAVCALAAALVQARDSNGIVCTLTADHIIKEPELLRQAIEEAGAAAAKEDVLITIGIVPTFPSTGFGYIEAPTRLKGRTDPVVFRKARRFVEKPDRDTAEAYLKEGHYFWNAGMFVWSVKAIAKALAKHQPHLHAMFTRLAAEAGKLSFAGRLLEEYQVLDKISVDYAILEKADNILMVEGRFQWDDVGTWTALENHIAKDLDGNVLIGDTRTLASANNIVHSEKRLTTLVGVKDLIIVQTDHVTLVCHKSNAQDVKMLVQMLAADPRFKKYV